MKYRLLKDYGGFAKDMIIEVRGQELFTAMNAGYGELYIEPESTPKQNEARKDDTHDGSDTQTGLDGAKSGHETEPSRTTGTVSHIEGDGYKRPIGKSGNKSDNKARGKTTSRKKDPKTGRFQKKNS